MPDLQATYDRIAKAWLQNNAEDKWWVVGASIFASLFRRGNTLLDMGCGAGIKTQFFAERDLNVTGIDFSLGMLETARLKAPTCKFEQFDLYKIEEYPQTFDGIWLQAVLLHVPKNQAKAVLEKLITRLNPGGYLYVGVKEIPPGTKDEEQKVEKVYGEEHSRFFAYYTMLELQTLLESIGLTLVWQDYTPGKNIRWLEVIYQKAG